MWQKIKSWFSASGKWLSPQAGAQKGAIWALVILSVVGLVFIILWLDAGLNIWLTLLIAIALAGLAVWLGYWALLEVYKLIQALSPGLIAILILAIIVVINLISFSSSTGWPLWLGLVLIPILIGGAIGGLRYDNLNKGQRIWLWLQFGLGLAGIIGAVYWFTKSIPDPLAWVEIEQGPSQINAANPAELGDYAVETLTYGSGTDRWRADYGEAVDILTESVNVRNFVYFDELETWTRELFWGFDRDALPLNGRVWLPVGEGPFPLVLIVHGNHAMADFSDEGYAYLGELLASRGFIVASVDQNFLNGYFTGGISGENDARAWMLLQHLGLWEAWNQDPNSQFYQKTDLENIALIGHSRGGEAVALAAAFNTLGRNPNNATMYWDYNFNIKTVIAIAPVDGQHQPAGQLTPLTDINYLVIQGAQDGDVNNFNGIRQYNRVSFSPESEAIKAAVYIHRANHGQFNSTWGNRDRSFPMGLFLNTQTLLDAEAQRQIAAVYISAFLETTLHAQSAYLPLFQDYQTGGDWLPPTLYINQYRDAHSNLLVEFGDDLDVMTTTNPDIRIITAGVSVWREVNLALRDGKNQDDYAVQVGWNNSGDTLSVVFNPEGVSELALSDKQYLIFDLGDARGSEVGELLDLHVRLIDSVGESVEVLISEIAPLMPQFRATFTTWPLLEQNSYEDASEPILQSYRIPLSTLLSQNPAFDLEELRRINFVFDVNSNGEVLIDDIGFSD